MRWIKIGVFFFFFLSFWELFHGIGDASLVWKGVSFYYRVEKVGTTVLEASLSIEREGDLYLVKAKVDTTGVTLPFFRMHNRFRSYVKRKGLEPSHYVKEVDQWGIFSRKKCYTDILTFDVKGSKVIVQRLDPPLVREVSVPPQTFDPLAIFLKYFLDEEVGDGNMIKMRIYDGIKLREVIFVAARRELSTPLYGDVKTVCLESKVPFSSLGDREGVIKIWYTDDERRFPVKISLQLPLVGNVEFQLDKVKVW